MKINRKTHLELRLQNAVFTLLFLIMVGLAAWLSTRYSVQSDWTASHKHTLAEASNKVLDLLKGPVKITAYTRENQPSRQLIRDVVERYSRYKKDLTLDFVNPDTQPDRVRQLGITVDGEMTLEYQGRTEKVQEANETTLTNALERLASAKERHIVFLEGHGERSPQGQANHDLHQFADALERKGITVSMINLAAITALPDNTDVLVIAGPRVPLLPGEIAIIQEYIKKGKNLWWLADSGVSQGLTSLAEQLGIMFLPGVVVDASTQLLGISDPTFALVTDYPIHPITEHFDQMTLFPTASALDSTDKQEFEKEPLLHTLPRSWTETGPIEGQIQYDAKQNERQGPLTLAYALTRQVTPSESSESTTSKTDTEKSASLSSPPSKKPLEKKTSFEQRIVVVGDGDFLSNAFLGNGGNLDMGLHMLQWLTHGDALINIPSRTAPDQKLELSSTFTAILFVTFLLIVPALLIGIGGFVWFQRRRR